MVKINVIYTRTGDSGDTGISDGSRLPKFDIRIETIGAVDEANSAIGVARLHTLDEHNFMLARIQQDLFDLGADFATPFTKKNKNALRISPTQTTRLENEIDSLNKEIAPIKSFILPGGEPVAAHLHMARAITRRAERAACELKVEEKINPEALKYLNRLSDFLFVLARATNDNGKTDILWIPGKNR